MKNETTTRPPAAIVATLLDLGKIDPLYRDLYLQRARLLMDPLMSRQDYLRHKQEQASVDAVQRQLRLAIDQADWQRVQELTSRLQFLRSEGEKDKALLSLGRLLYDEVADVPIDPFSPGLDLFCGVTPDKQGELRQQALDHLTLLQADDPSRQEFYARRHTAFLGLSFAAGKATEARSKGATSSQLQQEALQALSAGNLERLGELTHKLQEKQQDREQAVDRPTTPAEELLFSFTKECLTRARRLGMAPARVEPRQQYGYLFQHAWTPKLLEEENGQMPPQHLTFPADFPEALRSRLELYVLHPFVTSGGTRLLPHVAAEEFLVEDFPEPAEKGDLPPSELLAALGFEQRRWLTRLDLERALIERGPDIVASELGLDSEQFRLVCIPPDLHCRLGETRGWGGQQVWTHFDGYQVMKGGKLQPLAGGDVRFGGIYDMVSFGKDYAQERIIARFAVVQRKRMVPPSGW